MTEKYFGLKELEHDGLNEDVFTHIRNHFSAVANLDDATMPDFIFKYFWFFGTNRLLSLVYITNYVP